MRTGVWIVARDLRTPESTLEVIEFVKKHSIRVVIPQVAVGGYAYYPSEILPRTPYHSDYPDFDPLRMIIDSLKPEGFEIHAWINTLLYWSLDTLPDAPNHVCNAHPDWFIKDDELVSLRDYSPEDKRLKGIDGMFLDPTKPEVRNFVTSVYLEVARKYQPDFVHLDFVRYPGNRFGFTEDRDTALKETGVDPLLIHPSARAYAPRWHTARTMDLIERWYRWKLMKWNERRAEAVTILVKQISDSLQKTTTRLSGAVFPNPGSAYYYLAQDWREWQNNGSLNVPVPMAYTYSPKRFDEYLDYLKERFTYGPVYLGIGVWMERAENYVPVEIKSAQRYGFNTIVFFDFGNLKKNQRLINRLVRMNVLK